MDGLADHLICAVALALGTDLHALLCFRHVARRVRGLVDTRVMPLLADVAFGTEDMLGLARVFPAYRARLLRPGRATLLGHATALARMPRSEFRDAILEAQLAGLERSLTDATVDGRPMYAHVNADRVIARLVAGGYPPLWLSVDAHIRAFVELAPEARAEYAHGPICVWDTSGCRYAHAICEAAGAARAQWSSDLFWETGALVGTEGLFCKNAEFHGSLATWDVRRVLTMHSMFEESGIVDSGIGAWDTRSLTSTNKMFAGARNIHPEFDLSRWNVSALVDLDYMFRESSVVHAGLAAWVLPPDAEAHRAFFGAPNFRADTLRAWRRDLVHAALPRRMI